MNITGESKRYKILVRGIKRELDSLAKELPNYEVLEVKDKEDMLQLLKRDQRQIGCVVSNYESEGESNTLSLLSEVNEIDERIPLIIYTDEGSESLASEISKSVRPTRYLTKGENDIGELATQIDNEMELRNEFLENRKSKKKLEALVESSAAGIVITGFDDEIEFSNKELGEMLGYEVDELIGKKISDIAVGSERKKIKKETEKRKQGTETTYESRLECKSGEEINVLIDGSPYENLEGEYIGTVGVITDITERKKEEEKKEVLHSLLRHDIKNQLQIGMGYLQLIEEEQPEELKEKLEKIKNSMTKSEEIIEKVRDIMRLGDEEIREVEVGPIVEDVTSDYEDKLNLQVDLTSNYKGKVKGGDLLRGPISNLIDNSVKHSGGEVMKISEEETEKEVKLIFEDDGKGLEEEVRDKIFEKKSKGKCSSGSGLGLYITKEIITHYGGRIEVERSKELGGAKFEIYLKKAE